MRLISEAEVREHVDLGTACAAIVDAFADYADGRAAVQARQRIVGDGTKLSTMSAIIPSTGLAGAKIYTTVDGQFRFVVLLFDAVTGMPLACMDANGFTEVRTAATTIVVAKALANPDSSTLAIFGTGIQARAHATALANQFPLSEIRIVSRGDAAGFCAELQSQTTAQVTQDTADSAVSGADIVVTATRSKAPVFSGTALSPGVFVAAIGSTLPDSRELDDHVFRRANAVVVEWTEQSLAESGDLLLAMEAGSLDQRRLIEVADALRNPADIRVSGQRTVIYKSVGIALEDIAVAGAIWRRIIDG